MARELKNTVQLGIFVVVGVALFTATFYLIGNQKNIFGNVFRLSTLVSNASGLRVGNNVRYAGIVVGSVEDIVIQNDSTIQVDMVLENEMKGIIKKDALASIGMDGLVGDVVMNISPGAGKMPLAENRQFIASTSRLDPNAMMETLGATNNNVALLSLELLEISQKLNTGNGSIPLLIRDSVMAADIANTLHNLQISSENILQASLQMRASIDQISKGGGTLGYLLNDQTLPHQLESLATNLDSLYVGQTGPLIDNLKKSSDDIAAASAALKAVLQDFESGGGLATTLLQDTAAAEDLKEILVNLNTGSARFSENMEALKHNFLLKRYFKKQSKKNAKD